MKRCYHCWAPMDTSGLYVCTQHLFVAYCCSEQCLETHKKEHGSRMADKKVTEAEGD